MFYDVVCGGVIGHSQSGGCSHESPEVLQKGRAVRMILCDDWDPIGIMPHAPADEYDPYVWPIFGMVTKGAGVEELAAYLHQAETVTIGMSGDLDRARRVAALLIAAIR